MKKKIIISGVVALCVCIAAGVYTAAWFRHVSVNVRPFMYILDATGRDRDEFESGIWRTIHPHLHYTLPGPVRPTAYDETAYNITLSMPPLWNFGGVITVQTRNVSFFFDGGIVSTERDYDVLLNFSIADNIFAMGLSTSVIVDGVHFTDMIMVRVDKEGNYVFSAGLTYEQREEWKRRREAFSDSIAELLAYTYGVFGEKVFGNN